MKKFIKIFFCFILMILLGVNQANALSIIKPKYTLKLPLNAFQKDLAVHNKTIYYILSNEQNNTFIVYSKSINSNKTEKIYQSALDTMYGLNYSGAFKLLSDKNLYLVRHIGGGVMGFDLVTTLSGKNKGKNILDSYANISFDEHNSPLYIVDPYYFLGEDYEKKSHYYSFNNDIMNYNDYNDTVFKFTTPHPSSKNNEIYLLKIPYGFTEYEKRKNSILVSIKSENFKKENKKEEEILKTDNFTMGENNIYYWKDLALEDMTKIGKQLWGYSFKDKSSFMICEHPKPNEKILPIENNIFFTATYQNNEKNKSEISSYDTLFIAKKNKCTPLFSNMKRIVSDGKNIAVLFEKENHSEVKIIDSEGIEFANLTVPVNQADIFISNKDLIVWSWQDKTVRYYEIF